MFTCDICGAVVSSKSEMKTHLVRDHLESEVICPFCELTGVNYDEMNFHIEAAHPEGNESEGGIERINTVQGRTSYRQAKKEAKTGVQTDLSIPGTAEELKHASFSHTNATLSSKTFNSENVAEFSEREPKPPDAPGMSSTSLNGTPSDMPECPFCGKRERYGEDVEVHIKIEHADLLDAPIQGSGQHHYECPMCRLVCTNYQILREHVDLHIEESSFAEGGDRDGCSSDLKLAQQLQEEEDRQRKYEESRQEMEEFQKLQRQYGLDSSGGYKQQQLRNMELEVGRGRMQPSEFHKRKAEMMESLAFGVDDGKTRTSGIIEALHRCYQNDLRDVRRVWLSMEVDHFHSSLGDKGWGCGYRNFQMLLSSLLRNDAYKDCLKDMSVPCIPKLQSMIEDAWEEGFDPQGASQLNNRLQGTKAWIGACEIYSLLTSLRLKCRIIDFHKSTGLLGTHPRLFEWVLDYYSAGREGGPKVVCSSKPPIYLQHQGHSRTIVGIEEGKNRTLCLLVFDPGCSAQEMQKLKQDVDGNSLKLVRRFVGSLKHKQYQIVSVDGVLSPEEKIVRRQASRVFTAERIP
ncbi:zinc finger-containing ubiquitin peptidase 1 [Tachyglossus aculeatus]|uniref:zinc finger-containing ubiquitin peptidase 1 n=1 Tax=Tachyglossus aculeatus TaxID=9261 RepID=UPI0018F50EF2|nr:zinc finger-containing ubiquitin peptidase 1 [Tachyglossus aculeatus]